MRLIRIIRTRRKQKLFYSKKNKRRWKNKYDKKTKFWFSNTTKRNKTYIVTFDKIKILVVLTERWVLNNNTNNNNKKRMNTINKQFYKPWKHKVSVVLRVAVAY